MTDVEAAEPKPDYTFGEIDVEFFSNRVLARAIAPLLLRAVEHSDGRYSFENVMHGLESGKFQIWGTALSVDDRPNELLAVAITTEDTFPSGKKAYVVLQLGGHSMADAAAFFKFLPKLEGIARQRRCNVMQIVGRKGWERDLSEWKIISTVYERELGQH